MADRYWVGGSGTWDATSTANWSETSGGPGGALAPTSVDNAYFDGSSDSGSAFTVTLSTGAVCKDVIIGDGSIVSVLDQTMTLAGSATWNIYGSLFFPVTGLVRDFTSEVRLVSTNTGNTITTNGLAGKNWTFSSPTGGWTLGSSLVSRFDQGYINVLSALFFDTAGYNLTSTAGVFSTTSGLGVRNIYLRNSVVSGNRFYSVWLATAGTFVDAGTSTIRGFNTFSCNSGSTFYNIICEGGNIHGFNANGATFNSVEFLSAGYASTGFTTNELKITTPTSSNAHAVSFSGKVNVTGTFSANPGNSDLTRRWRISSDVQGTPRTITAAAVDFGAGLDFEDIIAAGAAVPWDVSTKNGGNCGGNTNITFPEPKTVYWNLAGTQNWSANGWALTSGGTPAVANFPLVQDTVVFDNNSAGTRVNINANYRIGTINLTGRTLPITFSGEGVAPQIYGDFLLSSAVALTGNTTVNHWTFRGRGVQNIRTAGVEFVKSIEVNSPLGTFNLLDPLTVNINAYFGFIFSAGTINLNDFDLTSNGLSGFRSLSTVTRHINFGSAKIVGRNTCSVISRPSDPGRMTATGTKLFWVENYNISNISVSQQLLDDPASNFNLHINSVASGVTHIQLTDSFRSNDFSIAEGVSVPLRLGQVYANFHGNVTIPASVPEIQQFNLGASGIPGGFTFRGSNNQTLTVNGQTVQGWIDSQKSGGTLTIANDTTVNGSASLSSGTINLNGKKLTATSFWSNNTNARTLNMNGGTLELTGSGTTAFNAATSTNLTVQGPGIINLTSASAKTFAGGGANYSVVTLVHGGAGNLTITGNNTFSSIRNIISQTAGSSIIFASGSTTTITGKTGLSGTSSAPLYLASSSTGTYTINNSGTSIQQADYLSVNNSVATPANNWYAGTRSTVTNSTGWSNTFSSAADLFWVGGNGTWDSSTNTNWAVISGGAGGTIAPTSTNNITFDSNSDTGSAFTVTVGTGAVCKTFSANSENPLDQAMTLAGTASCSINESLLLPSVNFTRTYTGTVNFVGTLSKLINTNGVSFDNNFSFNGVATYNLQSSLTNSSSRDIYFSAGIINTNNFNVSSGRFFLTSTNLQQVNLGSSTITISGGVLTGWQVESSATNLVLNSGTSLLRFSYTYGSLLDIRTSGSNRVYYNVEFINSDHNIISDITCNNLTMASAADFIRLRGNLTVNGTLTVLARSSERCVNFYSDALGSTVTANAVNFSRVFFKDITAAGASAPWSGQLGDMGNNNNIQFPASKTVYWRSTIGGRIYSNSWGFTPTGAIDVNAIPLPQDTGIILNNFPSSGQAIILGWRDMYCGLDFSQRTQSVILSADRVSFSLCIMGDLILSSSVSLSSTLQSNVLEFYPNLKDIEFNPAGQTITFPISVRSGVNFESTTARTPSINYGLNISSTFNSTKSISVLAGTFKSNNFELSCTDFSSSGSLTRAINLGTSKIAVSGNWNLATSTNLSFTGSGIINMSGTSAKTFAGGSANYSGVILNQGGSGELTITGNNQFGGVSNTVRPASIKFAAGSTTTLGKFMLNGSDGAPVTISSTTTGTRYTLTSSAGVFAPYYTSIRDSNATGGAVWRAPINYGNVDAGNNLGWSFSNINTLTDNFMVLFPSNLHLTF